VGWRGGSSENRTQQKGGGEEENRGEDVNSLEGRGLTLQETQARSGGGHEAFALASSAEMQRRKKASKRCAEKEGISNLRKVLFCGLTTEDIFNVDEEKKEMKADGMKRIRPSQKEKIERNIMLPKLAIFQAREQASKTSFRGGKES